METEFFPSFLHGARGDSAKAAETIGLQVARDVDVPVSQIPE